MLFTCEQGCSQDIGMSRSRELHRCEAHGLVLRYTRDLTRKEPSAPPKKRKPMKRSQPKRDWSDAIEKRDREGACRVCGSNENVEAAHVIGRASDGPKPGYASPALWVNPDSIVPLCGQFSQMHCHTTYDQHSLDLLEHLTPSEQIQAVRDAGGCIEAARRRTAPSLYRILGAGA